MKYLGNVKYSDGIRDSVQTVFKGYDHRRGAGDGAIWDMKNLTSDEYPVAAARKPRYLIETLISPKGLYGHDGLYWADGENFYAEGEIAGTVGEGEKTFASLGAYIVILPDKKYYNTLTKEFGNIDVSWSGQAKFSDGEFAGEAAAGCSIVTTGAAFPFKAGDGVEITGSENNDKTLVIREISEDKKELIFYENSFTVSDGLKEITIKRQMPDIDFLIENENRLWGCKGDTIYASKLGDIFNWNIFDSLSSDSYAVSVGSAGDFTAAASYKGYPIFFKEENIYKVYGDRPSNFQVMGSATLGVEKGSHKSVAVAGETLFYLSRAGVAAYSGGIPQIISDSLGEDRYSNAVGGSDGIKYYVSMKDAGGQWSLFYYDTNYGIWIKEDESQAIDFVYDGEMYMLSASGGIYLMGNIRSSPEGVQAETVESCLETGDFIENHPNRKGTAKVLIRLEIEEGGQVEIKMQCDSDGIWRKVKTLTAGVKNSFYLPIIPRRCDHYKFKFEGQGMWRLYSLTREFYSGSEYGG